VCQIVAGILNALGPDAEVSDDLYERMEVGHDVFGCRFQG
jgi:hypothetical protein